MNKKQKRLFSAYIVFVSLIILFSLIIVRFAIYQGHISAYADILHKAVYSEEVVWIKLTIIALVSLIVFSSIIFVGFLIFLGRKKISR